MGGLKINKKSCMLNKNSTDILWRLTESLILLTDSFLILIFVVRIWKYIKKPRKYEVKMWTPQKSHWTKSRSPKTSTYQHVRPKNLNYWASKGVPNWLTPTKVTKKVQIKMVLQTPIKVFAPPHHHSTWSVTPPTESRRHFRHFPVDRFLYSHYLWGW